MFLKKIPAGVLKANCYIIGDKKSKKALVIDPGGDADKITNALEENELKLEKIILTHGHGDHIGGVVELGEKTGAKVYIHEKDHKLLNDSNFNLSAHMRGPTIETQADELLSDGDRLQLGDLKLEIIHTPGHTQGGICILLKDLLFTGDTLFKGSIGRSDFPGGNQQQLEEAIKNKLLTLPEETRVLPGHGPESTIGIEKNTNPYLQ